MGAKTGCWHLFHLPKRTEAAGVMHGFFPLLVMARCPAFRFWQAQPASPPTPATEVLPTWSSTLPGGEGTARWRQRVREAHREKRMVFIGPLGLPHVPAAFLPLSALQWPCSSVLAAVPHPSLKTSE